MWNTSIPASHRALDFSIVKANRLKLFKEITGTFMRIWPNTQVQEVTTYNYLTTTLGGTYR
jgi:hypothetical protein